MLWSKTSVTPKSCIKKDLSKEFWVKRRLASRQASDTLGPFKLYIGTLGEGEGGGADQKCLY